jgi:ATP-dependent helicase YprA (DUF1998 family)
MQKESARGGPIRRKLSGRKLNLVHLYVMRCSLFQVCVYDGDTPFSDRPEMRENAEILITNPDMLHVAMLPAHKQFQRILANLR